MTSTTARVPHLYVECDIPAGQTLAEWRRLRDAQAPRRRRRPGLRLRLPRILHRVR
jgi:hypothetical protein